jgi:hypothetical protein
LTETLQEEREEKRKRKEREERGRWRRKGERMRGYSRFLMGWESFRRSNHREREGEGEGEGDEDDSLADGSKYIFFFISDGRITKLNKITNNNNNGDSFLLLFPFLPPSSSLSHPLW